MHFDGHATAQVDAFLRLTFDQRRQHGGRLQQARDIAHDDAGLPPVGRDHHHGGTLTGTEVLAPIAERCEIDGDGRQGEALATASADDEPSFLMSVRARTLSPGAILEQLALRRVERQSEQDCQECPPGFPAVSIAAVVLAE